VELGLSVRPTAKQLSARALLPRNETAAKRSDRMIDSAARKKSEPSADVAAPKGSLEFRADRLDLAEGGRGNERLT